MRATVHIDRSSYTSACIETVQDSTQVHEMANAAHYLLTLSKVDAEP